jgi:Ricin-type beta-trefoil lectin domain
MKILKFFTTLGVAASLAISFVPMPIHEASAQQTARPFVVLVNGFRDCCTWKNAFGVGGGAGMDRVIQELKAQNAEIFYTSWSSFDQGGSQGTLDNDKVFLDRAEYYINNVVEPNRPLILIGHSFGGDSLLSLAPRIKRPILFLGVLDPTAAGGLRREVVVNREVPGNVDYFFNRWQKNAFNVEDPINNANAVPFDSRITDGKIQRCIARRCDDQQEQSIAREANGSEKRKDCSWLEVTCPGFVAPNPFIGRVGRKGTKQIRLLHGDVPLDDYIQQQIVDIIKKQLAAYTPPPPITTPVGPIVMSKAREVCAEVDARAGWKTYELAPGTSLVGVSSVSGTWSVDDKNYPRVGPEGYLNPNLNEQYKYDRKYPFGALLMVDPGQGYTQIKGSQMLPKPITDRITLRINDSDSSLGDNGGTLTVCFGNEEVMNNVKLTPPVPKQIALRRHWEYIDTNGRTGTITFAGSDWVNSDADNMYKFKEYAQATDSMTLYDSSRDFYVQLYDDGRSYWRQGSSGTWTPGANGQWVNPTRFVNNWTNTCLASQGDSKAIDNPVVVSNCSIKTVPNNGMWYAVIKEEAVTPDVMWYVSRNGEIRNAWTNTCLASLGDSKAINNPVVVAGCSGAANMLWNIASNGEIRNRGTNTCLASFGDSKAIDNRVVVADCSGNSNILWTKQ